MAVMERVISDLTAIEAFHRFGRFYDLIFVEGGEQALHAVCGKRMTFPKVGVFRHPRNKKERAHIRLECVACEVMIEMSPDSWLRRRR